MYNTDHPTVLIAEDDTLVRLVAGDQLRDDGFEVIEVADGAAALAVLRSGQDIQALFSDIQMPQLDGLRLAQEARRLRPGMAILLTSGQAQPAGMPAGAAFVAKPYAQSLPSTTLRRLMAA